MMHFLEFLWRTIVRYVVNRRSRRKLENNNMGDDQRQEEYHLESKDDERKE